MIKSEIFNKSIFIFLLLTLILNLSFQIYFNRNLYTTPFNSETLSKVYRYSQFAPNPQDRKVIIDDYDLFAYSGYLYLKGVKPSEIQYEHPPLTKYLIGLSIFLFNNPNVIQIIFGILLLFLIYLISDKILNDKTISLIPPLLLSIDGTFKQQFALSYLDLSHALFIAGAIFFYLKAEKDKKNYLLTSIFLGATLLSKYLGLIIIPLLIIYTYFKRKADFVFFMKTLILIPIIYLLGNVTLFFNKSFITEFINLHIAIFRLYRSYLPNYPWGEIWRLLFTGQWRVWFGNIQFVSITEWSILWPSTLIAMFISLYMVFFKKNKNEALILISSFALLYLATNSFHVVFPRYLLIYLTFGYILLIFVIKIVIDWIVVQIKR